MSDGLSRSDPQLLEALGRCLRGARVEPPAESVVEVRARADALARTRVVGSRRRFSWGRSWWAPVIVAGTVTVGAGSAFAAGVPVPKQVRDFAADIGLPVSSPPTTDGPSHRAHVEARDSHRRRPIDATFYDHRGHDGHFRSRSGFGWTYVHWRR